MTISSVVVDGGEDGLGKGFKRRGRRPAGPVVVSYFVRQFGDIGC